MLNYLLSRDSDDLDRKGRHGTPLVLATLRKVGDDCLFALVLHTVSRGSLLTNDVIQLGTVGFPYISNGRWYQVLSCPHIGIYGLSCLG